EHDQVVGVQQYPDLATDQSHRDRIAVGADGDLGKLVNPRSEPAPGLEQLARKRLEQRLLGGEQLSDRARPSPDPALLIDAIPSIDHRLELIDRLDLGNRDEVVTAKPADLPLHAALLMRPTDPRLAVERVEVVVRAKCRPPIGFLT